MSKPVVIGVDVDDVVAGFIPAWLAAIGDATGIYLNPDDFEVWPWDIRPLYPEHVRDAVYEVLNSPTFYGDVRPIPGARQAIKGLRGLPNAEIIFITSCMYPTHMEQKLEWLRAWGFLWGSYDNARKSFYPAADKSRITVDYLLDDNQTNVETCQGTGVLVWAPHNHKVPVKDGIIRLPERSGLKYAEQMITEHLHRWRNDDISDWR